MMISGSTAVLHSLADWALAFASWGGMLYASRCIVRRHLSESRAATQLVAMGVTALALAVTILQVLGAIGCFAPLYVAAAAVGVGWISHSICGAGGSLNGTVVSGWCRERSADGFGLLFCIAGILVFQAVARGLRCPPLSHDSLTYHAFLPARWIQLGGIEAFAAPGAMEGYRAFPMNFELLIALAVMPFRNDLLINLVNLPMLLLAAVVVYDLAREIGATARAALWAPAIFCLAPPVWGLATTQYNDVPVAALMGAGVLFLIQFLRTDHAPALMMCAVSLGVAAGMKYSALPLIVLVAALLVLRVIVMSRNWASVRRLFTCAGLLIALGGQTYVRNWIEFSNPVYPFEVKVAGRIVFEGSPMQANILEQTQRGTRADDWRTLSLIFSRGKIVWGPVFLAVALAAAASIFTGGSLFKWRLLVAAVSCVFILSYFLPDDGMVERTRRMFSGSSQRMLSFAFLCGTALAVTAVDRLLWPAGLVGVPPALIAVSHAWQASYPQPPSFAEIAVMATAVLAGVAFLAGERGKQIWNGVLSSRRLALPGAIAALLVFAFVTPTLVQKRNDARYYHYSKSYDYHPIARHWVASSLACDESDASHVIALARPRCGDSSKASYETVLNWFFYPLLGSRWQNKIVYASVHEAAEISLDSHPGSAKTGLNERAWLANLDRLGADRLVVANDAMPEVEWAEAMPSVFRRVKSDENYAILAIDRNALEVALKDGVDRSEGVRFVGTTRDD